MSPEEYLTEKGISTERFIFVANKDGNLDRVPLVALLEDYASVIMDEDAFNRKCEG